MSTPVALTQGETYDVEVVATDGGGASTTNTYQVRVKVNQLPTFASTTYSRTINADHEAATYIFSFDEADSSDTAHYLSADDPEDEAITYALAENDEFRMLNNKVYRQLGQFTGLVPLTPGDSHSITVTATDLQGGEATATLEIVVNRLPTFASTTYSRTIDPDHAAGTYVFSFNSEDSSDTANYITASDADAGDAITYTLAENDEFELDNERLVRKLDDMNAPVALTPGATYSLTVTAEDSHGGQATATLSIAINNP